MVSKLGMRQAIVKESDPKFSPLVATVLVVFVTEHIIGS
jgi:hypothetical protein